MDEYFIYWIDKYSKGHRQGASHAIHNDKKMVSICGIDFKKKRLEIDGGYITINESLPDCKNCLKQLVKINLA